jgi:hypothetical protein
VRTARAVRASGCGLAERDSPGPPAHQSCCGPAERTTSRRGVARRTAPGCVPAKQDLPGSPTHHAARGPATRDLRCGQRSLLGHPQKLGVGGTYVGGQLAAGFLLAPREEVQRNLGRGVLVGHHPRAAHGVVERTDQHHGAIAERDCACVVGNCVGPNTGWPHVMAGALRRTPRGSKPTRSNRSRMPCGSWAAPNRTTSAPAPPGPLGLRTNGPSRLAGSAARWWRANARLILAPSGCPQSSGTSSVAHSAPSGRPAHGCQLIVATRLAVAGAVTEKARSTATTAAVRFLVTWLIFATAYSCCRQTCRG